MQGQGMQGHPHLSLRKDLVARVNWLYHFIMLR